jgi:hypothetical protein
MCLSRNVRVPAAERRLRLAERSRKGDQRLARAAREWEIEQQQKRNPGNDNDDDTVWKLQKR